MATSGTSMRQSSQFDLLQTIATDVVTWQQFWNLMNIYRETSQYLKQLPRRPEEFHQRSHSLIISSKHSSTYIVSTFVMFTNIFSLNINTVSFVNKWYKRNS